MVPAAFFQWAQIGNGRLRFPPLDGHGFDLTEYFIALVVARASYREPLSEFSAVRFPYRGVHGVSGRRDGSFIVSGEIGFGHWLALLSFLLPSRLPLANGIVKKALKLLIPKNPPHEARLSTLMSVDNGAVNQAEPGIPNGSRAAWRIA
jgi:hypothetical protein